MGKDRCYMKQRIIDEVPVNNCFRTQIIKEIQILNYSIGYIINSKKMKSFKSFSLFKLKNLFRVSSDNKLIKVVY